MMLSRLKEPLRKLKRRHYAIDRSIRLSETAVLEGYTDEGSPYFSLRTPLTFRCPIDPRRSSLGITLFCNAGRPRSRAKRIEAHIVIDIDGTTRHVPLRCVVGVWDTVAIDLSEFGSTGDRGQVDVTLRVDGPHRETLSLGQLRMFSGQDAPIKKGVQGVSYPRSGHGLLATILQRYFGPEFYYCPHYELGCHATPCANPGGSHFQKSHDHELTLQSSLPDTDYLIQFRHPLYSIVSNFYLAVRDECQPVDDTQAGWRSFAISDADRWKHWMNKWVINNQSPRTHMLVYESMMEDPQEELLRVIEFFSPEHVPNRARLAEVIQQLDVRSRRCLADFPYYDSEFFQDIEQRLESEIEAAGLPRL